VCLIQVRRLYAKHWLKERSIDFDSEAAAAAAAAATDGQPHLRIVQSLSGNQGKHPHYLCLRSPSVLMAVPLKCHLKRRMK